MSRRNRVIACGVFEHELRHLAERGVEFDSLLLDAGLHSRPDELHERLQEAIDSTDATAYHTITLLYGLCGRAVVGLETAAVPLLIPRLHDCIGLFLGSSQAYWEQFRACPGTLYLTPGWCEKEAHPDSRRIDVARHAWSAALHPDFGLWAARYGDGAATWIVDFLQSWRQHYQRIAYIDTGLGDAAAYRRQAAELSAATGWSLEELPGSLALIEALASGQAAEHQALLVPPHHRVVGTHDARLIEAVPLHQTPSAAPRAGSYVVGERGDQGAGGVGLGVDAGGTFTDAVLLDRVTGEVLSKAKAPTTPHDLAGCIEAAIARLDHARFGQVSLVALSTTLATNAIVEGRGARVGLLLMPWNARSLDDLEAEPVRIVPGRLNIDGEEVDPVDPEAVRETVRQLLAEGVEALAISGYAGTHNPVHELAVQAAAREVTDLPIVCGHELSGKLDFVRRAHTAVLNARLLPVIGSLLDAVERGLRRYGIGAPVFVVRGDGSLIDLEAARGRPIDTLLSGPAASAGGARFLTGDDDLLAVDIGGTTTDIAVVHRGRVEVCPDGPTVGAWRTSVAAVDILTSGLGGDSYLRLLDGGSKLDFGPQRATPLASLAARYKQVGEELEEVAAGLQRGPVEPEAVEFLELVDPRRSLRLSDRERAVVDLLHRGPAARRRVAAAIGAVSVQTLGTERLEGLGVVRRAAVTPTDLLHVLGRLDLFCARAAHQAVRVLAASAGREPEGFAEWAYRGFIRKLAYQVMRRELSLTLGDPDAERGSLLPKLFERMLTPDGDLPYGLQFTERRTIVGIGAPAGQLLPAAGALLGANVVVPEHAEVANAIGAITGKVTIRASVSIRPDVSGSFLLLSALRRGAFVDLSAARAAAEEALVEHLRARAAEFGTDEQSVRIEVGERMGRLSDGSDLLIEVKLEGILEGQPRA